MTYRAVLWDIDGTLVLSEPFHLGSIRAAAAGYGIDIPSSFASDMLGRSAREIFELIRERFGLEESFAGWVARWYGRYLQASRDIPGRPGALEAFHALHEAGVPQALVSNSDRIIVEANVRAMSLLVPRLVSVSGNDVRKGKPDPEPYLRAAYLLGVEPAECVVVEDSPAGTRAGLAAGMRVLAWPEVEGLAFPHGVTLVGEHIGPALGALGLAA